MVSKNFIDGKGAGRTMNFFQRLFDPVPITFAGEHFGFSIISGIEKSYGQKRLRESRLSARKVCSHFTEIIRKEAI